MDPYLGEIRMFAGNFAPRGWAFCNGSLMPISQNTALFSILGTQFGGDGRTNFALPDLRGRVPMHKGQGPGLSERTIGEESGESAVTVQINEMPGHNHVANSVSTQTGKDPTATVWANSGGGRTGKSVYSANPSVTMNPNAIGVAGGSQPHNNLQPYLAVNFIIALEGVFPSRP
jgi:microcystin-dependent protein